MDIMSTATKKLLNLDWRMISLNQVKDLIRQRVDVNTRDIHDRTALMHASLSGHTDIVKMLIEQGADVNAKSGGGDTALMMASFNRQTDIVKMLIERGAGVDVRDDYNRTALIMACWRGYADIAKMLIEHGADVNAKDKEGKTSLQWARINGHTDLAQFLEKAEKLCQQEADEERKPRSPALHHMLAHGEQQGLNASLTEEYMRGNDISISITNRTLRNGR